MPTIRGNSHAVPCSAINPRFENTVVKLASDAANRRSHIMASTKPPPAVTPLTAAITGFRHAQQIAEQRGQPIRGSIASARGDAAAVGARDLLHQAPRKTRDRFP